VPLRTAAKCVGGKAAGRQWQEQIRVDTCPYHGRAQRLIPLHVLCPVMRSRHSSQYPPALIQFHRAYARRSPGLWANLRMRQMASPLCTQLTNRICLLRPWLWIADARSLSVCSACRTPCAPAYLISMVPSRKQLLYTPPHGRRCSTLICERGRSTGELFKAFERVPTTTHTWTGDRADGSRRFLHSRGIVLPEGSADDEPQAETVHGLGEP
jgi:hypothetical protein